jgi:hypothetical protein
MISNLLLGDYWPTHLLKKFICQSLHRFSSNLFQFLPCPVFIPCLCWRFRDHQKPSAKSGTVFSGKKLYMIRLYYRLLICVLSIQLGYDCLCLAYCPCSLIDFVANVASWSSACNKKLTRSILFLWDHQIMEHVCAPTSATMWWMALNSKWLFKPIHVWNVCSNSYQKIQKRNQGKEAGTLVMVCIGYGRQRALDLTGTSKRFDRSAESSLSCCSSTGPRLWCHMWFSTTLHQGPSAACKN